VRLAADRLRHQEGVTRSCRPVAQS
jgi:hypothetical protein